MTLAPALARPVAPSRAAAGYSSRPVALATRHGKAAVLGDVFAVSGLLLIPVDVDTDRLGTFTGETPRTLDLVATATAKARLGAAASGLALNAASEGSFGPDLETGMLLVQREVVALVDAETGLVVHGRAAGYAPWVRSWRCTVDDDLAALVAGLDLHRHRLTVRPATSAADDADVAGRAEGLITKAVTDLPGLRTAVDRAAAAGPHVVVETDLRAHVCPMRHAVMREAAADLVVRLATRCPDCGSPGFGPHESIPGAACRACGDPTDAVSAVVHACPACGGRKVGPAEPRTADPAVCGTCNP